MDLVAEPHPDALVIRVKESRIDAAVAIQFKDRMRELTAPGPARVILDLSRVDFIDSSGLGAIVSVMKSLAPAQRLELAALTRDVGKVFRLTRMDSVFAIHDTAPEPGVADAP
ncbi:STAS domain-containing protein [Albidovulum sp.]